jgi:hypothetical protein
MILKSYVNNQSSLNNFHLQRTCIISITIIFVTQDWDKSLIPKSFIPFPGWTLNIFVFRIDNIQK